MVVRIVRSIVDFTRRYPVSRGMIAYAILWPASNVTQQLIQQKESIDWKQAVRFSIYGAAYTAPTAYAFVRTMGVLIPGNSLRVALTKVVVDQLTYGPHAIVMFYIGLGLLEGKTLDLAVLELKAKFLQTYKTGMCFWPLVQTLNFLFIKERNRVMVISIASFFWTTWMSYMKSLEVTPPATMPHATSTPTIAGPRIQSIPKLAPN